jgi:hypothetical protein
MFTYILYLDYLHKLKNNKTDIERIPQNKFLPRRSSRFGSLMTSITGNVFSPYWQLLPVTGKAFSAGNIIEGDKKNLIVLSWRDKEKKKTFWSHWTKMRPVSEFGPGIPSKA